MGLRRERVVTALGSTALPTRHERCTVILPPTAQASGRALRLLWSCPSPLPLQLRLPLLRLAQPAPQRTRPRPPEVKIGVLFWSHADEQQHAPRTTPNSHYRRQ